MTEFGGLEGRPDGGDYCYEDAEPDDEEFGNFDESVVQSEEC